MFVVVIDYLMVVGMLCIVVYEVVFGCCLVEGFGVIDGVCVFGVGIDLLCVGLVSFDVVGIYLYDVG